MAVLMGLIGQAMASWHREGRDRMRNGDSTGESGLATPRAPLNEPRLAGWIGRSIRVEGKVVSTEDLTIDGHVKGSIKLGDHSLTIGPSATIRADLVAKNVTISGAVTGNVRARGQLHVRATGSVVGDIVAARLVMAEGAVITGHVDVGGNFQDHQAAQWHPEEPIKKSAGLLERHLSPAQKPLIGKEGVGPRNLAS